MMLDLFFFCFGENSNVIHLLKTNKGISPFREAPSRRIQYIL